MNIDKKTIGAFLFSGLVIMGNAPLRAEPTPDPELVFEHAFVDPPPNLREGWDG